ncbi:hypothetical protein NE555_15765, partial [Alistipes onderdonkii]|uniref:hypothetical protein n=1 Tax=Alistipes onderdonkii TaxID=328813 RepID=UPI00210BB0B1
LNGIQTIINNDLQTQREIAALVYGVDVEDARQIPLKLSGASQQQTSPCRQAPARSTSSSKPR